MFRLDVSSVSTCFSCSSCFEEFPKLITTLKEIVSVHKSSDLSFFFLLQKISVLKISLTIFTVEDYQNIVMSSLETLLSRSSRNSMPIFINFQKLMCIVDTVLTLTSICDRLTESLMGII